MAVKGSFLSGGETIARFETELIVLDLETGEILIRCKRDFGIDCSGHFLLERERLIVENRGKIYSLRFWV